MRAREASNGPDCPSSEGRSANTHYMSFHAPVRLAPVLDAKNGGLKVKSGERPGACMQVLLNSWPKNFKRLRFGDLAASPSRYSGFAIVNSTAGNLRGRGVLCKASDGVIAHNRFFNLMGYALQMSPEFYWNEADYVNNVLVINNTVNSYGGGMFLGDSPLVRAWLNAWLICV